MHPALGPFAPPPATAFDEINREIAHRAAEHEQAIRRWGIGLPFTGAEQETLVASAAPGRGAPAGGRAAAGLPAAPALAGRGLRRGRRPTVALTALSRDPAVLAGLAVVPAAFGWTGARLARVQRSLDDALPLDLVAHAICDAYRGLGELSDRAAASLAIEPRASGTCAATCPRHHRGEPAVHQRAGRGAVPGRVPPLPGLAPGPGPGPQPCGRWPGW